MTAPALILRHLVFTGPDKPPAALHFEGGLNVIYGASETGKSFVLEAIDYMLGGSRPLRDIPERVGYDRVFLGVQSTAKDAFTLVRATSGGQFQLFEGLHDTMPKGVEGTTLASRHNAESDRNVSNLLLDMIGLKGKRVKTRANGDTQSLSFRNLCHLCVIPEGDMQKQGSPIESGRPTDRTAEYATLKVLLTGMDDSALVSAARDSTLSQSRAAKLELIDDLLATYKDKLAENADDPAELAQQLDNLEATIAKDQNALRTSEDQYQALVERRNALRQRHQNALDRRGEINELLARFALLDQHYLSDLARLDGIREAGCLVALLAPEPCPLCGAEPDQQHRNGECDSNLELVVSAADAERAKIVRLRRELDQTVRQLRNEADSFDRLMPRMREDLSRLEDELRELAPGLTELRNRYVDLLEKKSAVRASLALWQQLADLEARREALAKTSEGESAQPPAVTDLSTTTLFDFSAEVEHLLKAWHFPDAERVHFDQSVRDLIINGKRRGSRGKGMRAVTHAAFTIGLLGYCQKNDRPHPGFVVLDSPLLAYREPEGSEDDLTGTDVKDRLYEHLAGWTHGQVIIIENIDPPTAIKERPGSTFFSKNPHQGRYGFFPLTDTAPLNKD